MCVSLPRDQETQQHSRGTPDVKSEATENTVQSKLGQPVKLKFF